MSDFLDNLGKVLNNAACKAVKASGDAVELTKTSVNIKLDEIKCENYFKEIGRVVYEQYKEMPDSASAEALVYCKCIDELEEGICEKRIKAAKLKGKKYCAECEILLDDIASFCYSCGEKQPETVAACCGCENEADTCCEDGSCECS